MLRGLYLNKLPQTKAQKDIIIPEYSSLMASVEEEVALYLGTLQAGFMAFSNHPLPTEHI